MTSPASSQPPAGAHPLPDDLADLAKGITDSTGAAAEALHAHLAGCPDCRDLLAALTEVRDLLGSVDAPPMPADVADRLDAALAAEAAGRTPAPGAPPAPASPAPAARPPHDSRHSHGSSSHPVVPAPPAGPGRRRRAPRRRLLLGSALALVAVTLGALLLRTPAADRSGDSAAGASAASAPADLSAPAGELPKSAAAGRQPALGATGPVYREATLAAQVRQLVGDAGGAPAAAQNSGGAAATTLPCAPAAPGPLLAGGHGTFEGEAVDVLVHSVPGDTGSWDVYLVDSGCPAGSSAVLLHRTVPAR